MDSILLRMIGAAVVAVLLAARLAGASGVWRRRAFGFGAAAFALLAISNGLTYFNMAGSVVVIASFGALLLIAVALVALVRAYQTGEMRDQFQRARDMVDEERRKIAEQDRTPRS
ncbi:MAG: hypothetical protein HC822_13230 [Oscillochloris sp.]|nr:hypothetical protein [Oscillochloris sp.]